MVARISEFAVIALGLLAHTTMTAHIHPLAVKLDETTM